MIVRLLHESIIRHLEGISPCRLVVPREGRPRRQVCVPSEKGQALASTSPLVHGNAAGRVPAGDDVLQVRPEDVHAADLVESGVFVSDEG